MKNSTINLITAIFCFFITLVGLCGCYPVHSLEKYPSKAEYYKDANSAFEGKEVKVSLVQSDSAFYAEDAVISNDSINMVISKEWETRKIKRSDIKSAAYFNKDYDNLCARLELNNGEILNMEKITMNQDSIIDYEALNIKKIILPLTAVKYIRYKNYLGIPVGILVGGATGLIGGSIWYSHNEDKDREYAHNHEHFQYDNTAYLLLPRFVGPVIGLAAGWIIGGRTTWEFNK
jgi:hypothetical protein